MKFWNKNTFVRWLRIIHRDLGFLMVGVCLIYAVSGILLNHMNGKDPAFKTEQKTLQLKPGLSAEDLDASWRGQKNLPSLRKVFSVDEDHYRLMLEGGVGIYNTASGLVDYELHTKRQLIYWINKLHYNKVKGWSLMADFFAVSLIFFAVSGLWMVRGKKGMAGRGKWFLLIGLLIPVLYVLLM